MKYFQLLLLVLPFLAASCTKPLPIEIPEQEQKLVVSSVVVPGNLLALSVSRTFSVFESLHDTGEGGYDTSLVEGLLVEHARVTVQYNGLEETLVHVGAGLYLGFLQNPQPGDYFHLSVYDSISRLSATAGNTMLPTVAFTELKPEVKRGADTAVAINYTIEDQQPSVQSFYMVNYHFNSASFGDSTGLQSFLNEGESWKTDLWSDADFKGGKLEYQKALPVAPTDTLTISVTNISEGYFRYLQARRKAGSFMNEIAAEPITYPTNIQGGYGYFNTHNPRLYLVDLNDY